MKDRLITAIGGIAAIAAIWLIFANRGAQPDFTRPLSEEPGRNGYLALADWLRAEGVAVASWRLRFDALLDEDSRLAPAGNILLTTMPHTYALRQTEIAALNRWVRRGNTLLVMAALNDSPEWLALVSDATFIADLSAMTVDPT